MRSGLSMVLLVVVMAVVLILVAKAWQKAAPDAIDVTNPGPSGSLTDGGQTEAAEEVRSGGLPRMQEARESTDAHAEQVQEALDAIE